MDRRVKSKSRNKDVLARCAHNLHLCTNAPADTSGMVGTFE